MDEESLGIHTHIKDNLGGNINIRDIGNALTVAEKFRILLCTRVQCWTC